MLLKKILLCICLCLHFPLWSTAQVIWPTEFPFAAELPSNEMTCIHQDRDGFIWTGTTNGLSRYDGYRLHTFQANRHDPLRLTHNHITCLTEDSLHLWVGTAQGITLINKQTYRTATLKEGRLRHAHIQALCNDGKNTVWVAATHGLVLAFHLSSTPCDTIYLPPNGNSSIRINSLFYDPADQTLWLCTSHGIYTYFPQKHHLQQLPPDGQPAEPTHLFRDHDGRYWFGTWGQGLWQLIPDENGKSVHYIRQDIPLPGKNAAGRFFSLTQDNTYGYIWTLSYNKLHTFRYDRQTKKLYAVELPPHIDTGKMYTQLLHDRDGNLWAASYDGGTLLTFHTESLHNYPLPDIRSALDGPPNLLTLNRDRQGRFWFVQDRFGLCLYDPTNKQTILAASDIRKLTVDARVTTYSPSTGGLWIAAPHGSHVRLFICSYNTFNIIRDLKPDIVKAPDQMKETPDGKLYLRCGKKILCYDAYNLRLLSTTPDSLQFTCMSADTEGRIWGVTPRHLYLLKSEKGRLICVLQKSDLYLTEKESIRFLATDEKEGFWAVTDLGRILHAPRGNTAFQDFSDLFDTQGQTILNLLCQKHHLWLISHNRIIHYDIQNQDLHQYFPADGHMAPSIFRDQAASLSTEGILYAGGRGGIVSITPSSTHVMKHSHPVVLTDIRNGTKSLLFTSSPRYTHGTPSRHTITLLPEATNLAISFSTLDYTGNTRTRYAYRLGGIDKEWNYLSEGENTAYYQNLPKGKYRLFVKTTDTNGKWQSPIALLDLTRLPAWYETLWAYIAYAATILLITGMLLRFYLGRLHSQNQLKLQEELTRAKLDYFTNISHDLLTPLGVISCIGDYWEQHYPKEREQTDILHHNISRLKRLLGQALDFRKTESGKMELNIEQGDIFTFSRQLFTSMFLPLARQKGVYLCCHIPEGNYPATMDFDKTDKILYNLISNAVKYTPKGKKISFTVEIRPEGEEPRVHFSIQDEGPGIPHKEQAKIFERFYTGSNGKGKLSHGIGLALSRELATLHHGSLTVNSEPGKGSCFTLSLPINLPCGEPPLPSVPEVKGDIQEHTKNGQSTILLVDDHTDLTRLMGKVLSPNYRILSVTNGQEALTLLEEQEVDLIVSDIMMPVMDGLELCYRLKTDLATSHIPIIILTAKQSAEDQTKCYEAGADGYLSKPFDLKVLAARIDNLIHSRKNRQQTFRKEDRIQLAELNYSSSDTQFLQNMADLIHTHLAEEDFGLEQLATALNVSKSTLHRKVKAMTGLTPLDFIRNIKLKYACIMLSRHNCTIAEVAYATGFSTPKYFTKCFKEEFGITPTAYQQQQPSESSGTVPETSHNG